LRLLLRAWLNLILFFHFFYGLFWVEGRVELHYHGQSRVVLSHLENRILSGLMDFKNHLDYPKLINGGVSASRC
jgi:hypothetical protein